jgi:hypothetical protein
VGGGKQQMLIMRHRLCCSYGVALLCVEVMWDVRLHEVMSRLELEAPRLDEADVYLGFCSLRLQSFGDVIYLHELSYFNSGEPFTHCLTPPQLLFSMYIFLRI